MPRLAGASPLFLAVLMAVPAWGQGLSFYRVVDDNTPRPDGKGNFQAYTPALDGNTVVFVQGSDSLWAFDLVTGKYTKLVDTTVKIPGGTGTFNSFDLYPVARKGMVVFRATDANVHAGLYAVPVTGAMVTRLADMTTLLPGSSETFSSFTGGGFSHDGNTAVFQGSGTSEAGIFSVRLDGTGITRVATNNTPLNSDKCDSPSVTQFLNASISGGNIAFVGSIFTLSNPFPGASPGFSGVYLGAQTKSAAPGCTGPSAAIVNSLQVLPRDTAVGARVRFDQIHADGTTLYFVGDDPGTNLSGLYSAPLKQGSAGGTISRLVDTSTVFPDVGQAQLSGSFQFAADQGNVFFYVNDLTGSNGEIFLWRGGTLTSVLGVGDGLDGYSVSSVNAPTPGAVSGNSVALSWMRSDSNNAVVVARPFSASVTVSGVVNGASYEQGILTPGEIVTIFGAGMGPATLVPIAFDSNGRVATQLGGTRVLFNGIAAPLLYVGAGQIGAIAPYGLATSPTAQIVVETQGNLSAAYNLQVVTADPGLFSANGSGTGQGAILNVDGSLNSAQNPAAKGSIVVLFGTGEGITNPPGVDGQIDSTTPFPKSNLPVSVTVGGLPAVTLYAGAAPFQVAGLFQINVTIPAGAAAGNLPVVVTIGSYSTIANITVAVK